MFGDAFQALPRQVETIEAGVLGLQLSQDAKGLFVMVKTAAGREKVLQDRFPSMTEGRVAKVMSQRESLRQIFVQAQLARDGTGDLRHFQGMGQAGSEVVTFMVDENLGLVLKLAKGA